MAETLIFSLTVGIFVGVAAGYLGSLMVLEKMALVGDALSHVALPVLLWEYYMVLTLSLARSLSSLHQL
jgi:ABC-type Mn2+/Zn2+ transport system permease subunit